MTRLVRQNARLVCCKTVPMLYQGACDGGGSGTGGGGSIPELVVHAYVYRSWGSGYGRGSSSSHVLPFAPHMIVPLAELDGMGSGDVEGEGGRAGVCNVEGVGGTGDNPPRKVSPVNTTSGRAIKKNCGLPGSFACLQDSLCPHFCKLAAT